MVIAAVLLTLAPQHPRSVIRPPVVDAHCGNDNGDPVFRPATHPSHIVDMDEWIRNEERVTVV